MTLPELIARLEKAGPDAELGRDILRACGWRRTCVGHFYGPLMQWSSPDLKISFPDDQFCWHDPTVLIDAARKLVPEHHGYYVREDCSADGEAVYCNAQVWPYCDPRDDEAPRYWANAPQRQPAIALCIAALRARSAQKAGG